MALIYDNRPYKTRIKECLADDFKVAAIKKAQDVFYDKRNTVVADVPESAQKQLNFVITFLTIWITM